MTTFGVIVLWIVIIAAYWVPTIVGAARHVPNIGSVAVINAFLGWTLVGWVVAIAMAARSIPRTPQYVVPPGFQPPPQPWPQRGQQMAPGARIPPRQESPPEPPPPSGGWPAKPEGYQ